MLGLLREEQGLAARALRDLGVPLERVRERVVQTVGRGEEMPPGQIPFTPRAKKVLELALREEQALGHTAIGTEHILLGLVREGEGVGSRTLAELGATPDAVRVVVMRLLPHGTTYRYRESKAPSRLPRVSLLAVGWALGVVSLGAGILVGWAIWV